MEKPIKKSSQLVPKMFRTFALYIILTLSVFFGYIQIYGNLTPNAPGSDSSDGSSDDTFFGNFVSNILAFEDIDTDVSFSIENTELQLALAGNVQYKLDNSQLFLDLDLNYKDKTQQVASAQTNSNLTVNTVDDPEIFKVVVTYTAPYLYVKLNDQYYKFDCKSDLDLTALKDIIANNVKFDDSTLAEILDSVGLGDLDLNTIVPDLLQQLQKEPQVDAQGNFIVPIEIKELIRARLVCDSNYNPVSIRLANDTIIDGNTITFEAKNIQMNGDLDISVDETKIDMVDLCEVTDYLCYTQNLFENDYVTGKANILVGDETYLCDIFVDNVDSSKVRLSTNFEGLDISISYASEEIFLDVSGLKLRFKAEDYPIWQEKINVIVENQTSKNVAELIQEILVKYFGFDSKSFDFQKELMQILAGGTNSQQKLELFLPNETISDENFVMLWENGAKATLSQGNDLLKSIVVECEGVIFDASFELAESGFDIDGEYYDLTQLLPLVDIVDEFLTDEQFGGELQLLYKGEIVDATFVVNYAEKLKAQISTKVFGEDIEIFVNDNLIYLQIGDVVLQAEIDKFNTYMSEIERIFDVTILDSSEGTEELDSFKIFIEQLDSFLQQLKVTSEEGTLAVAQYLTSVAKLSLDGEMVLVDFVEKNYLADAKIYSTTKQIAIPQNFDNIENVLEKIESTKLYIESGVYAGRYSLSYKGTVLSGSANIDLDNEIYDISIDSIGNNNLRVVYTSGVAYVTYDTSKIKVAVEDVNSLVKIIMPILAENGLIEVQDQDGVEATEDEETTADEAVEIPAEDDDYSISETLTEIFGADVSTWSLKDILKAITIDLDGNFTNLVLSGEFDTARKLGVTAKVDFAGTELSKVDVDLFDRTVEVVEGEEETPLAELTVTLSEYTAPTIVEGEYFDLAGGSKGNVTLVFTIGSGEEAETIEANVAVELDLTERIYFKESTTILGMAVEVVVYNSDVFVTIGGLSFTASLNDAMEMYAEILTAFEIEAESKDAGEEKTIAQAVRELLSTLNLNSINPLLMTGLVWSVNGEELSLTYTGVKNLTISATLQDEQTFAEEITLPSKENCEDLQVLLEKAEEIKDFISSGVIETTFALTYNEWQYAGTFKYAKTETDTIFEIFVEDVCGEDATIRIQNNTLYFVYGNVKLKYAIPESTNDSSFAYESLQEILTQITSEEFGIELNFGVFAEILTTLRDYTVADYFNNVKLTLSGTSDKLGFAIAKQESGKFTSATLLSGLVTFTQNKLASASINIGEFVLDGSAEDVEKDFVIKLDLANTYATVSTISEFKEEDYVDYKDAKTEFVAGMLDSLEVSTSSAEPYVYAFASDIAIRYSTINFEGYLTAMLVHEEGYDGYIKDYKPAIQIYTTALGFNSYIYMIDQTIYVDINGLQIYADISKESIEEILAFVETNFSTVLSEPVSESSESGKSEVKLTDMFRVVLPAVDMIYGSWLEGGLQIDINDSLWYCEDSRFYDIVLQTMIKTDENGAIMPTEIVLGANIDDPNTTVNEDGYADYWLDCEKSITQNLNFAVYFNDVVVGNSVGNLDKIFVVKQTETDDGNIHKDYKEIVAVQSNRNERLTSTLEEFNDYKTVIDATQTILDYGLGMQYQLSFVNTSIVTTDEFGQTSTTTFGGDVTVEVSDDTAGTAQFELFGGKILKVQGDLDITAGIAQNVEGVRHLISLLYDNAQTGLYATYTHGDQIGQNYLRAKVGNANMSDIITMMLGLLRIELSDEVMAEFNLKQNTTDFRYLQTLMKMEEKTEDDGKSLVDKLLAMISDIASYIKDISLTKTEIMTENVNAELVGTGLKQTNLSIVLDWEGADATVNLVLREEQQTDGTIALKLRQLSISNFKFGNSVLNTTINIDDFKQENFDYDTTIHHIDFSDISSFVDVAVNTVNQKAFNYSGNVSVVMQVLGSDAMNLNVGLDILAGFDANNKLDLYVQLTFGEVGTLDLAAAAVGSFKARSVIFEYSGANQTLNVKRIDTIYHSGFFGLGAYTEVALEFDKTYNKNDLSSKLDDDGDETSNMSESMAEIIKSGIGVKSLVYAIIEEVIKNMNPQPRLEQLIVDDGISGNGVDEGFMKTNNGYLITINAENLTGMSDIANMNVNLGMSSAYNVNINNDDLGTYAKQHYFIETIDTKMVIGNSNGGITMDFDLGSVYNSNNYYKTASYTLSDGSSYGATYGGKVMYTNDYYRKEYIKTIGTLV